MRSSRCILVGAPLAAGLLLAACGHSNGVNSPAANKAQQAAPAAQPQAGNSATNQAPSGNQPLTDAYPQQQSPQQPPQQPPAQVPQPEGQYQQPQTSKPLYAAQPLTIPRGTTLAVRLDESLSSSRNRAGDRFSATLSRSIVLRAGETIPRGTRLTGRVVWARPSGHLKTPAELSIALTSLDLDGRAYEISTSHYAVAGRSHKKHDLKWIAGSAAGGALLGGLIGHGKGVAIGSLVGAGGGTVGAFATGKKDIYLPAETPVHFVLRQPLVIARG